MGHFRDPLEVIESDEKQGRKWVLDRALTYVRDNGKTITAERGFVTDGASVPRIFWAFLSPWGLYSRAAVIHDRLLDWIGLGTPHTEAPTRRDADKIFLEMLDSLGIHPMTKVPLYVGVSIGTFLNPLHPKDEDFL